MDQPTRRGKHREAREFDKTQLHEDNHGQKVHRDYAAHFFRWVTFKEAMKKGEKVLDIGCGQDQPLAKILSGGISTVPGIYVGVDLNRVKEKVKMAWAEIHDEFNFIEQWEELKDKGPFDKVACFEVIEHMEPPNGVKMLTAAKNLLADNGKIYLSTPVFDGYAAVNHLHEYSIEELHNVMELAGLNILHRWGTFGNVKELEKVLTPEEKVCWDSWASRLGNDGLSVVFATNHPDQSRNNLWLLSKQMEMFNEASA
jgi:2-polyprenyl-3-methyl-5-hydroxy-6-metoxy-1,4-benzoquinol methylase